MPVPKHYNLGWRVTIKKGGKKIHRRFQADRCGGDEQAYAAACQFIRITLSEKQAAKKQLDELAQVIAKYHEWSEKVRRKSPETLRKQYQALGVFSRFCERRNVSTLGNIDTALCLSYQQWFYEHAPFSRARRRDNYDPSANWHKYHQFLNAFMNWCLEHSYIKVNPAKHKSLKPKYEKRLPNPFKKDELKMMFKFLDQDDPTVATYFRTILYTGMRPGEAISLKWDQVNLQNNVIQIVNTKTKTPRSIPLHPELHKLLKSLPKDFTYVFDSGRNEPLGDDKFYHRKMRRACTIMEIPHHKPYDLRHTFATNLVIGGVHIGAVKELLGHARVEQTLVYVHFAPQHLKSAIDKLVF